MTGTLVNVLAVLVGTAIGLGFGRLIPERIRSISMQAIGLAVLGIGLQMAIDPRIDPAALNYAGALPYHPNPLVIVGSFIIGSIIGELAQLELRLERFGNRLQQLAARIPAISPGREREPDAKGHNLVEGFMTASLLYCVGAMAVIGSIKDGTGDPSVLYIKALLDGVASIALASTLGVGVALSVIPLAIYQGGISLASSALTPVLTLPVLSTLTSVGGMLIAAIGLDILGIKRLKVGNMLPAVFVGAILAYFVG
jgi:uncharacterized membrane protein YqgA involved in biofilm formation